MSLVKIPPSTCLPPMLVSDMYFIFLFFCLWKLYEVVGYKPLEINQLQLRIQELWVRARLSPTQHNAEGFSNNTQSQTRQFTYTTAHF